MPSLLRNRWFGLWLCVAVLAGGKTIHNYSRGTYGLALAGPRRSAPSPGPARGQVARPATGPAPASPPAPSSDLKLADVLDPLVVITDGDPVRAVREPEAQLYLRQLDQLRRANPAVVMRNLVAMNYLAYWDAAQRGRATRGMLPPSLAGQGTRAGRPSSPLYRPTEGALSFQDGANLDSPPPAGFGLAQPRLRSTNRLASRSSPGTNRLASLAPGLRPPADPSAEPAVTEPKAPRGSTVGVDSKPKVDVPRLRLHAEKDVWGVAFSKDGKELLGVGYDYRAAVWQVWNTTNGASRRIYRAAVSADNELGRLAFAPDSGLVALADNGAVKLWDLKRGMPRQLMKAGIGNEVRLAFSGDGSQLAVAVDNGVVLYEMPSGRQRLGVVLLLERPEAVAFSPDGRTVAVAGGPGKTIVFAAETGQSQRELVSLPGSSLLNRIGCLVFSPDGGLLAGIGGGDLALWNVEQGALVAHERQPHGSHPNGAFCPGASGLLAVTGQPDGAVRFWSLPTKTWRGQVQTGHQGGMSALAFSPDGALLATAGLLLDPAAARVRLWEVAKYLEGGEVKSSTPP